MERLASEQIARIRRYYDETWFDYRFVWNRGTGHALHYGYWDAQTRSHGESLSNTNRILAAHAGFRRGERVLDAGCGVGETALWIAREYAASVVGVNVTPGQLSAGRREAIRRGLAGRTLFACQDHGRLGFRAESFDVVYSIESMCYAEDKPGFLAEAHRVLRPGGRLVVFDGFRTRPEFSPRDERLFRSWLEGWEIPHLAEPASLAESAHDIGYDDVAFHDVTHNVRPSVRRLGTLATALYPAATVLRALGLRSPVQHGNVEAARRQRRAMDMGLWVYGVFRGVKRR